MRTTVSIRAENGEQIHIRKSSYRDASQQALLRALGLAWIPGVTERTVMVPKT